MPSKPYMHKTLSKSSYQHVVRDVMILVNFFGAGASEGDVRDVMVELSRPVIRARNAIVEPLQPAYDFLGMGQAWGLFLQSGRSAHRIQVEGSQDGEHWQLVYRHHGQDSLDLSQWLAFRRVRGIYSPSSKDPRAQYEGFVTWLAREVCRQQPGLRALRVSFERIELGTRQEPNMVTDVEFPSERPCEATP